MDFEKFKELALNPPRREEETIFEVTEYDVDSLPEHRRQPYPKFDVSESRVGFARSLQEAETLIRKAIDQAKEYETEIYCFHVREFPIGEILNGYFGVSARLYDSNGSCIDQTYCSDLMRDHGTEYGHFRGRVEAAQRFKPGDIVEVLYGDKVALAVAVGSVFTPEWCWERMKNSKIKDYYIWDDSDDQVTVIDGPGYDWHEHVSPLLMMHPRYPIPARIRKRFESYYDSLDKRT